MRLINTETGQFEEFFGSNVPSYAILSHTWEKEEVSFQDMKNGAFKKKKGYAKIFRTCQLTSDEGFRYAWVDTCCIDQSSSAELTEAINSMYRWYERSAICYTYLSDLPANACLRTELPKCRWFTRGWTLQELIAPDEIHFFDRDWNLVGSKGELLEQLGEITGIRQGVLRHTEPLSSICVAQKMSWAADRVTTRVEDTAYCLLGLFAVNMPLLYGEEEKAFRRLQEAVIHKTPDLSIFAWSLPRPSGGDESTRTYCGVLADSPSAFSGCSQFIKRATTQREFVVSNCGIKTQVQILWYPIPKSDGSRYVLPLDCSPRRGVYLGVRLRKCGPDQFVRESPWDLLEYTVPLWPSQPKERFLLAELPTTNAAGEPLLENMRLFIGQTRRHALQVCRDPRFRTHAAWPSARYDDEDGLFFVSDDQLWDSGAMQLVLILSYPKGQVRIPIKLELMFYALGWASTDPDTLQCSIIDYKTHLSRLNDAQHSISDWEHYRPQVIAELKHRDIPKRSASVHPIPDTNHSVVVSFIPTLCQDSAVCMNKFWRITFSYKICKNTTVPPPTLNRDWISQHD